MSTRKAPYKHADGSNCWTKDCRLGHVRTAPAEQPETFEQWIPQPKVESPEVTTQRLMDTLVRPENASLDYDAIGNELGWVQQWEEDWTEAELKNLRAVEQISKLVANDPFTPAHEAKVRRLIAKLEPYVERPRRRSRWGAVIYDGTDNSWRARDKQLHSLASNLLTRRLADELTTPELAPATNERLLGLDAAQDAALKNVNRASYYKGGKTYMGAVESHFQNAIARVVSGENLSELRSKSTEDTRSLFSEPERVFAAMHPDTQAGFYSQLYLAAVFPVRELKAEMDRVGIENVSVTPFYNTREWGNAYTVMTPNGGTRTFTVYEHRNTDSIIINGTENWDGEDLPYAADSKQAFFAEFDPDDRQRAAQALTFYMMQAQDGDLASDEQLVAQVSRRDWAGILDRSIPGFKEWRQRDVSDRYIAPQDENEEDILKRLDF